jgi:DinB superfamily
MSPAANPDRRAIADEMDQARRTFHRLLDHATDVDLRRRSQGTKWTNEQLLFHMLFGYLITCALLVLARVFGRLPDSTGRLFARLLDTVHKPFHLINYLGSCAGARIIPYSRMRSRLDSVITALQASLETEHDAALRRGMYYPTTWDPLFTGYMTVAGLYRYPTQHFNYHRKQLTLTNTN